MSVYVDDARIPAQVGRYTARWSHLFTAGDHDELHAFAARIGLRREWFQHKPPRGPRGFDFSHYDVTDRKRQLALAAGAVAVSYRDTPGIFRRQFARRDSTDPGGCPGGGDQS